MRAELWRIHRIASIAHLTKVGGLGSFGATTESLVRGIPDRKVGRVSRFTSALYVRLVVLLAILAAAAIVLGNDPWGPR